MPDIGQLKVTPLQQINGEVSVPGDKSISHRFAMIGAIAEGETRIENFAASVDCQSTVACLRALGVPIRQEGAIVTVDGRGLGGLRKPSQPLDAGNSGTTVRLMAGLVAGCPFEMTFVGDSSLSRRPMGRIIEPLRRYGMMIEARDDNYLPMKIEGSDSLFGVTYTIPVASAQVKSALLLAALHVRGGCTIIEPIPTRNHTELALADFGAYIQCENNVVDIVGGRPLKGKPVTVPGDISSAAFFIAAALMVPNSRVTITGVGLNPTRTGFISLLQNMGAKITVSPVSVSGGEPAGNVTVETSELSGMEIGANWIPNVIDELPMLAVLGTRCKSGIRIRDAAELRAKESDRIRSVVANLKALGAQAEELPDGIDIPGGQILKGGTIDSFGDHRIAMAFAIGGLFAEEPVIIENPACVNISFPGFFDVLRGLATD